MTAGILVGGRYRVERTLGHGGMAVVVLARDEELARPVALKLLAEQLAHDASLRERFVREARLAAALAHPNIVRVFDAGEDGGRPYIVMECVEGETLADVLARRQRLPWREAVPLALQACAGLQHAHDAGMVHRDVKPQNLLLRTDGTVKLVDFGIARAAEATRLTQAGTILGTAAYLSPEQAAGEEVTAAADVYSLGAVLYELLTGRTPYTFETLAELAYRQSHEPIAPIGELAPDVPTAVEDAVMRCLARNPAYRPGSAAELARALAAGDPSARSTAVTEQLPQARPARTRRLPRAWILGVVAVLTAAVIGLAAVAVADDDPPAAPPPVEPVPRGETAAEQARNLAAWLRKNSR